MAAGIRDGLAGDVVSFNSSLGKWLYVKASLATLIVVVYSAFLWQVGKPSQHLRPLRYTPLRRAASVSRSSRR